MAFQRHWLSRQTTHNRHLPSFSKTSTYIKNKDGKIGAAEIRRGWTGLDVTAEKVVEGGNSRIGQIEDQQLVLRTLTGSRRRD